LTAVVDRSEAPDQAAGQGVAAVRIGPNLAESITKPQLHLFAHPGTRNDRRDGRRAEGGHDSELLRQVRILQTLDPQDMAIDGRRVQLSRQHQPDGLLMPARIAHLAKKGLGFAHLRQLIVDQQAAGK